MKNFVQEGGSIDVTLAATIVSGACLLVGSLFGVASKSGVSGDTIAIKVTGVFDLTYGVNAAVAVGDLIYWDDTGKTVTKTASSNKKIGYATKAAAANDATCRVRLVPNV